MKCQNIYKDIPEDLNIELIDGYRENDIEYICNEHYFVTDYLKTGGKFVYKYSFDSGDRIGEFIINKESCDKL